MVIDSQDIVLSSVSTYHNYQLPYVCRMETNLLGSI